MAQQPLHRPALLYLVLLLLLLFMIMNKSDGYSLPNLSSSFCNVSFNCGNNITFQYPFWLNDTITATSIYCGYPGFGISCSASQEEPPILSLPLDDYYVQSINYTDQTLTLIDTDLYEETCPRPSENVSLTGISNINYSPLDRNLTFFFNCTSNPPPSQYSPIQCFSSDGPNRSYVFTDAQFLKLQSSGWNPNCEVNVVVPVNRSSNLNNLSINYPEALQSGFQLNWGTARNCVKCEGSGGFCGYNITSSENLCFCSGGVLVGPNSSCNNYTNTNTNTYTYTGMFPTPYIYILSSLLS